MKEHLILREALDAAVIAARPEEFYYLARATFVKDEGLLDRFDQVFGKVFKGIETSYGTEAVPIPEEWLHQVAELYLTARKSVVSGKRVAVRVDLGGCRTINKKNKPQIIHQTH